MPRSRRPTSRARPSSAAMGPEWSLEILTRLAVAGLLLRGTRWQSSTAHLVELSPRLHVLRPEGCLNSLEQSFQPSDQLGLGDSDFRLAWGSLERDRERAQLVLRSEEHTSELQSPDHLVCRLLLEKKKFVVISYL